MTHSTRPTRRMSSARRILEAGEAVAKARTLGDVDVIQRAEHDLRVAVDAARATGMSWGDIGDALSIRRGLAYQRYRPRPTVLGQPSRRP